MKTLRVLSVTAALAIAGPLAGSLPAAAQEADLPRTGFERSGGATWTTLEEEQEFLAEVDERSDRVSVTELARTAQGRPLQLVQIGSEPRSQQEVAAGSSILLLCLQHGNEPAAREGCLQGLRDLAFDDSRETKRLLDRSTVLVLPTANPDGRAANTRANSQGVDINRDHLALRTVEAQTIARLFRDWKIDLLHDAHEYGGNRTFYNRELIHLWSRNLNVDDQVYRLARTLSQDYVDPAARAAGFTTGEYGIHYDPDTGEPVRQVAGDEDERILRNMTGLRHAAGLLVESLVNDFDGVGTAANSVRRVTSQVASIEGTLEMAWEQGPRLAAQTAAAERRATHEGRTGTGPFYFAGADNDEPPADRVLADPPCSYTLTPAQYGEVSQTLDLHGIAVSPAGDGVTVSMAQPARTRIPLLLDARANHHLVEATPVACA